MVKNVRWAALLAVVAVWACGQPAKTPPPGDDGGTQLPVTDDGGTGSGGPDGGTQGGNPGADGGSGGGTGGDHSGVYPVRPSPIAAENTHPGSTNWALTSGSRSIGAYVDAVSYSPGDTVTVFAASDSGGTANWELWRLGYYDGNGGRMLLSGSGVPVKSGQTNTLDPDTGMVRAGWPASFHFTLPADAPTGVYVVKLTSGSAQTYATFVVREATPAARILVIFATNTYQAYNDWGGTSLYVNNRRGEFSGPHAYAVSFDRPYLHGSGTALLFEKDRELITFAEAQGYDVAYATDADLDANPAITEHRKLVVFQGHSEYWSRGMRDAADATIARGTNLMFLGSNNAYWQVRYAPGPSGTERRIVIGYKDQSAAKDPMAGTPLVGAQWRDPQLGRPENALEGEMFGAWIFTAAPLTVEDPSMWIWTGANIAPGSIVPGMFGDEVDHRYANGAEPPGVSVVANAWVEGYDALFSTGETTIYTAPSGGQVFSSGTMTWSKLLAAQGNWDARIQQATANLFSRLSGDGTLGASVLKPMKLPAGPKVPNFRPSVRVTTVAGGLIAPSAIAFLPNGDAVVADGNRIVEVSGSGSVSTIAGDVSAGDVDGPASSARFSHPRGIAVDPAGNIYVSDTGNSRIRVISDGAVRTVAGSVDGFADGVGTGAKFIQPMGMAITASGSLLVADTWNQRLREVKPDGTVTTWAGTGANDVSGGPGASASLSFPITVAVLPDGRAAIAEPSTGLIRTVAPTPDHTVSVLLGEVGRVGWDDGPASTASVSEIISLAADASGQLFLVDTAGDRIRAFHNGTVDTLAGGALGVTVDGPGNAAGFGSPRAAAVAPDGSLWVVDAKAKTVRRIH